MKFLCEGKKFWGVAVKWYLMSERDWPLLNFLAYLSLNTNDIFVRTIGFKMPLWILSKRARYVLIWSSRMLCIECSPNWQLTLKYHCPCPEWLPYRHCCVTWLCDGTLQGPYYRGRGGAMAPNISQSWFECRLWCHHSRQMQHHWTIGLTPVSAPSHLIPSPIATSQTGYGLPETLHYDCYLFLKWCHLAFGNRHKGLHLTDNTNLQNHKWSIAKVMMKYLYIILRIRNYTLVQYKHLDCALADLHIYS